MRKTKFHIKNCIFSTTRTILSSVENKMSEKVYPVLFILIFLKIMSRIITLLNRYSTTNANYSTFIIVFLTFSFKSLVNKEPSEIYIVIVFTSCSLLIALKTKT